MQLKEDYRNGEVMKKVGICTLFTGYNYGSSLQAFALKEKISITIDADILEKIKYEAECDDRSLSQYINLVLKNHINSKNQ